MANQDHKLRNRQLRHNRVRSTVEGTSERPRLSVHISNNHVTAQVIDDQTGKTLAYATTVGKKDQAGNLSTKAVWVGGEIARLAKGAKIKRVVFDRGAKLYHGRVAALAEAARQNGLEF